MRKKRKELISCDFPGCEWRGKNKTKHVQICHPDYKPDDAANLAAVPPPEPEAPVIATSTIQEPPVAEAVVANAETPVIETPQEPVKTVAEKEKRTRSYTKIAFAVILAVIGGGIMWAGRQNPIVILFGASFLAGAFFLGCSGWNQGEVRVIRRIDAKTGKQIKPENPPNTLVIRCKRNDGELNQFAYEYVENPPGQRVKRRNDNTWWYVMREKSKDDRTLIEHILPDNSESHIFTDPEVTANALSLPATKRLFDYNPDTFQKVSLVVMGVIVAGELIALIALNGDTTQTAAPVKKAMDILEYFFI